MTIRALCLALPLLVFGWVSVLATTGILPGAGAPAQLVLLPSKAFLKGLPDGYAIANANALSVTLTQRDGGAEQTHAGALYAAGAWVVLPVGLKGCAKLAG